MGILQTKKIYYKSYCEQKKNPNQNKIKKRYKLYKEIAIDNKISPPWEVNLSPTRGLDFLWGFFARCCYNQYID